MKGGPPVEGSSWGLPGAEVKQVPAYTSEERGRGHKCNQGLQLLLGGAAGDGAGLHTLQSANILPCQTLTWTPKPAGAAVGSAGLVHAFQGSCHRVGLRCAARLGAGRQGVPGFMQWPAQGCWSLRATTPRCLGWRRRPVGRPKPGEWRGNETQAASACRLQQPSAHVPCELSLDICNLLDLTSHGCCWYCRSLPLQLSKHNMCANIGKVDVA